MTNRRPLSDLGAVVMVLRCGVIALCLFILAGAVGLLAWAVTAQGRWMGLLCLLLSVTVSLAVTAGWSRRWTRWVLAVGGILILFVGQRVVRHAPDGRPGAGARVSHRTSNPAWSFRRFALANMVPEVDQFMVGFRVLPFADPLFTRRQAKSMITLTRGIYEEMERDPAFRALGSVMSDSYADMALLGTTGHYFHYAPVGGDPSNPRPAIVFLHGSGGNFKAYTWLLREIADRRGMILIAPSFGFGN